MTVEPLDAEDAKLVVLARSAMARAEAGSGDHCLANASHPTVVAGRRTARKARFRQRRPRRIKNYTTR